MPEVEPDEFLHLVADPFPFRHVMHPRPSARGAGALGLLKFLRYRTPGAHDPGPLLSRKIGGLVTGTASKETVREWTFRTRPDDPRSPVAPLYDP